MQENNAVMAQIKNDYVAENTFSEQEQAVIEQFCLYASNWFREKNVVGLGVTTSGMALRFGDGSERLLFSNPDFETQQTQNAPTIRITGGSAPKFSKSSGLGPDTSVGITRG